MLTQAEFRTFLVVTIGGAIVLAGEVLAIGAALSGDSLAAAIAWLCATAVIALAVVAYGSVRSARPIVKICGYRSA